jgi:hypothetical protein
MHDTEQVSTVTKHIKLYSDNPIHDCIDRIIDACALIDEGGEDTYFNEIDLTDAVDDLREIMTTRIERSEILHALQTHGTIIFE